MTTLYKFKAYYTDAGVGAVQDPAPTCTVINMADDSKLADAQATTASTNMPGLYSYEYSGNDGLDCVAWFKTTDTGCDVKELASYVSDKITLIKDDTAAILADTGTDGVVLKADAVTEITNDIFAEVIENSLSYKQVIQVMAAVLAGKVTGGATGTITFKDLADAVNRVVMTVDASGNRSAVQTNFS